jgi:hypothetical protein
MNGAGTGLWQVTDNPHQSISIETHEGDKRLKINVSQDGYRAFSGEIIGLRLMFMPLAGATRFPHPNGFLKGQIVSGSWNSSNNRMELWMKCTKSVPTDEWYSMNIGTYVKGANASAYDMGTHYYHFFHPNIYANRWMKIEMNATPSHRLSSDPNTNWPADPSFSSTGLHYFDSLTVFYYSIPTTGASPMTCWIDDARLFAESGEPDEKVKSITATYTGSKYELTWDGLKNSSQVYEIRYSPSSMKTNGFNSGTDGGTRTPPGNANTGVVWSSPNVSENPQGMYFAIRPTGDSRFTEIYLPRYPTTSASPCDLNTSGTITSADADLAVQSALGTAPCTGDLDGNGRCDVVDAQRVINASMGGPCRTGS